MAKANALAAQGLVTWMNFPTLGPERGGYTIPACVLDGNYVQLEEAVDVDDAGARGVEEDRGQDHRERDHADDLAPGVGAAAKAAAGKNGLVGELLSLGAQATLTVLDTPDTRSWETLPARVAIARVRVPAGEHRVHIDARGRLCATRR